MEGLSEGRPCGWGRCNFREQEDIDERLGDVDNWPQASCMVSGEFRTNLAKGLGVLRRDLPRGVLIAGFELDEDGFWVGLG